MCGSNAEVFILKCLFEVSIEVRAIEVGVLGLNNGRRWRWSVCHSNARFIEVGTIEVGVLGLNNRSGWRWNVWFKCWSYRSRSYRSRGLEVEQPEGVAVECASFKCWKYRSRSYRSRGLRVEQREGPAVECVVQMLEL